MAEAKPDVEEEKVPTPAESSTEEEVPEEAPSAAVEGADVVPTTQEGEEKAEASDVAEQAEAELEQAKPGSRAAERIRKLLAENKRLQSLMGEQPSEDQAPTSVEPDLDLTPDQQTALDTYLEKWANQRG